MKHCQRHGPESHPYCVECARDEYAKEHAEERLARTACSLSSLNEDARRYRKEHFQRANADPTDTEAREAYHYEEGRTRAYSEGLNALAVWENAVRNLRDVQGRHHTQIATERLIALLPENAKRIHPHPQDTQ